MYYTITNAIGTEVELDTLTLVCGEVYESKVKATKDADYILAFSKVDEGWRFDGKADLQPDLFVEEVDQEARDILAWKSEKINIQSRIRPSKDSKKALAKVKRVDDFAALNAQLVAGEITPEDFFTKTSQLIASV
jgi:hypothetical protein